MRIEIVGEDFRRRIIENRVQVNLLKMIHLRWVIISWWILYQWNVLLAVLIHFLIQGFLLEMREGVIAGACCHIGQGVHRKATGFHLDNRVIFHINVILESIAIVGHLDN